MRFDVVSLLLQHKQKTKQVLRLVCGVDMGGGGGERECARNERWLIAPREWVEWVIHETREIFPSLRVGKVEKKSKPNSFPAAEYTLVNDNGRIALVLPDLST